jgi:hypothetical protein
MGWFIMGIRAQRNSNEFDTLRHQDAQFNGRLGGRLQGGTEVRKPCHRAMERPSLEQCYGAK